MLDESKTLQIINNGIEQIDYSFKNILEKAKMKPPMKRIFGDFLQTGEICLLAGKTGAGKSILAYCIADGVANGTDILGQPNDNEPQTVLYYDFELGEGHLQKRFSNYTPSDKFLRPNIREILLSTDGKFNFSIIANDIDETGAKVVIIDNITAISLRSTQDQDEAMNLMKNALILKETKGITLLLIAHTIKKKENTPLELYDIAGSGHIHNFIDNALMVGKSAKDVNQRYVKQVKNRNTMETDEVMTVEINTKDWLHYDFVGFDKEATHLPAMYEVNTMEKTQKLLDIANEVFDGKPLSYNDFVNEYANKFSKSVETGRKKHTELNKNNIIIKNPEGKWIVNGNEEMDF